MSHSFFSRWRFVIAMAMFFMLPFIWMGTKRALLSNRNDVRDWLPAHFEQTADHRWFQEHFPNEQFVLCSWEGCTLDEDDRRQLRQIAQNAPVWDGQLISEAARDRLRAFGYVRTDAKGNNWLTAAGDKAAVALGFRPQ